MSENQADPPEPGPAADSSCRRPSAWLIGAGCSPSNCCTGRSENGTLVHQFARARWFCANSLAVPLLLVSGILLPMSLAPGRLRFVSNVNSVKHIVDALRALFRGQVASGTVGIGVVVGAALIAAGMAFGTRTF